jgi:hypothetical protein
MEPRRTPTCCGRVLTMLQDQGAAGNTPLWVVGDHRLPLAGAGRRGRRRVELYSRAWEPRLFAMFVTL